MEPIAGIVPGGSDEDNEGAITEDVFIYFTPADPVDDSELGETWIMDKVDERCVMLLEDLAHGRHLFPRLAQVTQRAHTQARAALRDSG